MAEKFKAGDVVKLKSGGPKMTVVNYGLYGTQEGYKCRWFDEKNQPDERTFTEPEIELVPPES